MLQYKTPPKRDFIAQGIKLHKMVQPECDREQ